MGKKDNHILILGSGTSTGTPMIGCQCSVCQSPNPKNRRLRASIYLTTKKGTHILIDTTPDLRYQLLSYQISHIDYVIITHDHADHLHGIDDLRPLCFPPAPSIPIYASDYHSPLISQRFPYIFNQTKLFSSKRPIKGGGIPQLLLKSISFQKKSLIKKTIKKEQMTFFLAPHNYTKTLCFVHDRFAYLPDCQKLDPNTISFLKKSSLDLIIIDCLQYRPHDTHLNIEKAFHYIHQIAPQRAGLIHMNHTIEHEELAQLAHDSFDFPVFPIYDGQNFTYSGD